MLYPILVEYYLYFGILLLAITWLARKRKPELRLNLLYGYGMLIAIGFLLSLDWMGGVIFGLLVLEAGRVFKAWLDKKEKQLKS
ncbi:hypothetical protein [Marinomonas epiphytica]